MFTVTLHHLSADAKKIGREHPDLRQAHVSEHQLHRLIDAFGKSAAQAGPDAKPELRIDAAHGRFVIQATRGKLRFNSWTVRVGGADLSPAQIFAIVTGAEDPGSSMKAAESFMRDARRGRRPRLALLVALVLGANATTAWLALRPSPPNPLLPEYKVLGTETAARVFAQVAGEYVSGTVPGARGLSIARDGSVHWVTFGADLKVEETSDLKTRAVESRGRQALLAGDLGLIEIPDAASVVFFNETYRRKAP
jgi:hypothetical protein